MVLFQVYRIGIFSDLEFASRLFPPVFPREIPNYHSIPDFPMVITGPSLSPAGKGEAYSDKSPPNTLY
jgi:hypothetical protein